MSDGAPGDTCVSTDAHGDVCQVQRLSDLQARGPGKGSYSKNFKLALQKKFFLKTKCSVVPYKTLIK